MVPRTFATRHRLLAHCDRDMQALQTRWAKLLRVKTRIRDEARHVLRKTEARNR